MICAGCGKDKPESEFATRNDCSAGVRRQCKTCRAAQRRARYLANPETERYHSWRAPEIDVEAAKAALAAHDGLCELCGRDTPGGMGDWHVDHVDGVAGAWGVLCAGCNTMLGKVEKV